ncbi:MAG: glycosyltransferase [Parvularculaceae bacterium]|nr:glycosyltransferase [Parvularculaceae bacterium]
MSAPEISVIVPFVNSLDDVRGALSALAGQKDASVEAIVVERIGAEARAILAKEFPAAIIIASPSSATIPEMRETGFARASAPIIAVIEDHVIVPDDWAKRMKDAIAAGADVVGGPIENAAVETQVDWAAFLCEYSATLPPLPGGESDWLPGNNVAYRTDVLRRYQSVIAEGKWENRLHDAMRADGVKLTLLPDLIVDHKMHYTFGLYMSQRYLYARSYAGARVREKATPVRIAYGFAAFILPALMYVRTVRRIVKKGRHLNRLWPSLPMLAAFTCSWGAGEIVGYWFGAGDSLSKVR